jgi:hypothetical protein
MNRFAISVLAVVPVSVLFAASAWADICMYRDAQGHITYSNVTEAPPKDATKIRCFKEKQKPSTTSGGTQPSQPTAQENFPSVDRDTQRKRDAGRRSILEDELAVEVQKLQNAQRQLEEQEAIRLGNEGNYQRYLERVQPYRDAVQTYERNVQALRRELETLR